MIREESLHYLHRKILGTTARSLRLILQPENSTCIDIQYERSMASIPSQTLQRRFERASVRTRYRYPIHFGKFVSLLQSQYRYSTLRQVQYDLNTGALFDIACLNEQSRNNDGHEGSSDGVLWDYPTVYCGIL